ncbi:MAG: hypothetical protein J6Z17_02135 [Treponema sp.]|nr:hypothetical protein [Treponema sp.]
MSNQDKIFSFLPDSSVQIREDINQKTKEPWLMLEARRKRALTDTLCWGITNNGSDFARIGTQEGDLLNGFVHEDPYKTRMLGSYLYITDLDEKKYFTATWYPVMHKDQKLETVFRFGSAETKTSWIGLDVETIKFIPEEFDGMIQYVKIKNTSGKDRKLRVFSTESVNVGDARGIQFSGFNSLMMAGGLFDKEIDGLVWHNNYGIPYDADEEKIRGLFGKVLAHVSSEKKSTYSSRYKDFVGHYTNTMANPDGVLADKLSEEDSQEMCSSLSVLANDITLKAGEEKELVFALIASNTEDYYCNSKKALKDAMKLIATPADALKLYKKVTESWKEELDMLKLNVSGEEIFEHSFKWLQYQCAMVCCLNRMKSRFHSGFEYGFGFRDILQDMLALLPYDTKRTRDFLLYTAEQMFSDGTVYHNFYVSAPGTTDFHACDDPMWLIYAVCEYIKETADYAFLDEIVPYADVKEGKPDKKASVMEHCVAALNHMWEFSKDGLPTMFDADWNDDLSGFEDHLSVMAAEMLYKAYVDFAELCAKSGKMADYGKDCAEKAKTVLDSVNKYCIDSKGLYTRLVGPGKDVKKSFGSSDTDGIVFLEPTAWAGYSGVATKEQFMKSVKIVEEKLSAKGGICICTPNDDLASGKLPAYESGYIRNAPGKKENASFFRHLESWVIASYCRYGEGKKAWDLFYNTLPAVCYADTESYSAEPYVYPEYVAGPASQDFGRAGHTWLTGTAPTRHRVIAENIFGLQPDYDGLVIDPCVPCWEEFSASRIFRGTTFDIKFINKNKIQKGVKSVTVDGKAINGNCITKEWFDGKKHNVVVEMGE